MLININQCSWSFFNGIIIVIRSQFFFFQNRPCRCVQNPAESFVVFRVKARSACQSLHKRKHARVDARAVMECTGSFSYWLIQARALFLLCIVINETFQLQKTFALPVFRRESCWLVTYLEWVLLGVLTNKEDNGKRNRKGLKSSSVCLSLRKLFFIALAADFSRTAVQPQKIVSANPKYHFRTLVLVFRSKVVKLLRVRVRVLFIPILLQRITQNDNQNSPKVEQKAIWNGAQSIWKRDERKKKRSKRTKESYHFHSHYLPFFCACVCVWSLQPKASVTSTSYRKINTVACFEKWNAFLFFTSGNASYHH